MKLTSHYSDKPSPMEGYPMRKWSIEIVQLDEKGEEVPATIFSKVTYLLHESFGPRAKQGEKHSRTLPPVTKIC